MTPHVGDWIRTYDEDFDMAGDPVLQQGEILAAPSLSAGAVEARVAVLDRLCDCETTAQYGHSSAGCKAAGVVKVNALIAVVQSEEQARGIEINHELCDQVVALTAENRTLREALEARRVR